MLNVLCLLPAHALSLEKCGVWLQGAEQRLQGAEQQLQGPCVVLLLAVLALICDMSSVLPSDFWPPVRAGQA